ncbi:TPA: DNA primase [bacterium]|nr:DNA primase [bacterium]
MWLKYFVVFRAFVSSWLILYFILFFLVSSVTLWLRSFFIFMAFIPERILEEVREANDLVEIIASYFPLKKIGKNYKCLCPFHSEKTPSFTISPERQIFHCFGCSAGGNVFTFVMKMENLTFPESIVFLAEKAGIKLELEKTSEETKNLRQQLIKINNAAAAYFYDNLTRTKRANDYLAKRGITENSIKRFKLGYAEKSTEALKKSLEKKGFSKDILFKSGLLRLSEEKDFYYDYFRDRIIFPIQNERGECIAFGGRVLDDSALPKYLNSPETLLYHKGKVLYGFSLAKEAIGKKKRVIIVEGYLDLIKIFQAGIENVAASLGTALTLDQIRVFKRWTENIMLCFDSDEAGYISTCRAFESLLEEGLKVKAVFLPQGYDPDRYITEKGAKAFQEKIDQALDPFDYKMKFLSLKNDRSTTEGKLIIAEDLLNLITKLQNPIERSEYLKRVAETMHLDEAALIEELKRIQKGEIHSLGLPSKKEKGSLIKAQEILIGLSLEGKETLEKIANLISPADFTGIYQKIFGQIIELSKKRKKVNASDLISNLGDNPTAGEIISSILLEKEKSSIEVREKMLEDCIRRTKREKLKEKLKSLKDLIKEREKSGDINFELLAEYQHFSKLGKTH